jgi:TolB-like protein/class 3 adenylate cyclase/Tfp pilus assembly protein PilF
MMEAGITGLGHFLSGVRVERRLAAVLAADVAGYSRLMGLDEERTLADLKAVRRNLTDPTIAAHRGRIVKTTGDGLLVEFASAVDAVRCAIEVQRGMETNNLGLAPDVRIEFRIGIHVGDIIIDDNDIFGDGVNIAARLEGIADPGGVCLSDDAQRQVRGKVDMTFDDIGLQSLKNIAEPMRAWRMRLNADVAPRPVTETPDATEPLTLPDKPSIAVLPFQNMSGDPEQDYFADGMVEDITTALSRNSGLFVISRNSSFTYKGKAIDVKQVGRELGVRYVLEGSVRKMGSRIRITGQLIDTSNNAHLWADRFDGGVEDVFDLQDQVTSSVIGAIAPKIEFAEIERSTRKTGNLQAYDYYLRGMSLFYRFTREAHQEARTLFEKAISLDPNFAMAQTGIAAGYIAAKAFVWVRYSDQEVVEIEKFTRNMLALAGDDARVMAHAGQVLSFVAGRPEEGAPMLHQAVSFDPNFATGRMWLANASLYLGELDTSREHYQNALRLNPRDPRIFLVHVGLANVCFLAGNFDEALKWALVCVRQSPAFSPGPRLATACYAMLGQMREARESLASALRLDPDLRISEVHDRSPFRRPEHVEKFAQAYRLAGMPE